MDETHRYTENQRYSETYSSEEYSRVREKYAFEERLIAAEFNDESAQVKSSSASRKKKDATKTKLIAGTLMPAVGTVAGAAVITVAVLTAAVLQLAVASLGIGIDNIFVRFSAKNAADAALTAYLSAGEERHAAALQYDDGDYSVYFDSLTPDTEYLMEVVDDASGEVVLSQSVRTAAAPSSLKYTELYVNASERVMEFDSATIPDGNIEVSLDKTLYSVTFGKDQNVLKLSGLEGGREYLAEISVGGEVLLWEKFVTPEISLEAAVSEFSEEAIGVNVSLTNPKNEAVELRIGFNGETVDSRTLDAADNGEVFTGLDAYADYDIEVIRKSDGSRLYLFSQRTATHLYFTDSAAGERIGGDGYPVTELRRVSDSFETPDEAMYFDTDVIMLEGYGDILTECVSESGLELPVVATDVFSGDFARYIVMTEYAASGEVYYLKLSAYALDGSERVFETRRICLSEEESRLDYPEFEISGESDETTGMPLITAKHTGKELFGSDGSVAVTYIAEVIYPDGRLIYVDLEDFATAPEQRLFSESIELAESMTVRITAVFDDGMPYVIYSRQITFDIPEMK